MIILGLGGFSLPRWLSACKNQGSNPVMTDSKWPADVDSNNKGVFVIFCFVFNVFYLLIHYQVFGLHFVTLSIKMFSEHRQDFS